MITIRRLCIFIFVLYLPVSAYGYSARSYGDRLVSTTSAILPVAFALGITSYLFMRWIDKENFNKIRLKYILFVSILTLIAMLVSPGLTARAEFHEIKLEYGAICLGLIFPTAIILMMKSIGKIHRIALIAISLLPSYVISFDLTVWIFSFCVEHDNPLRLMLRRIGADV